MGLYSRYLLPPLLDCACSASLVTAQRLRVVPQAQGRVLDCGIGSGLNLPFYDPARVTEVVGIDPNARLLAYARQRARALPFTVDLREGDAEQPDLPSASFDTIVVTYTLCSIPGVQRALGELRRVLKPAGRLLFCEHGRAPDASVRRWQERLSPLWLRLAGGCHLARDVPDLLRGAGFRIERLEQYYVRPAPRFVAFHSIGAALPPAAP